MKKISLTTLALCALFLTSCQDKLTQSDLKDINGDDNGILLTCNPTSMTIDVQYLTPGGSHSQYQGAPCEPSTENLPPSGQQQQGGTKTDNPTPKSTSAAVKTGSATAQLRPLISTPSSTFQLQEDYPILLPLPLGPLFPVLLRFVGSIKKTFLRQFAFPIRFPTCR